MGVLADTIESIETDLLGRRSLSFKISTKRSGWEPSGSCWRCASVVGPHEVDGDGCASCRGEKLAWERALCVGAYESHVRDAVRELKFNAWRRTGRELGAHLGEQIREALAQSVVDADEALIVPVPMTLRRRLARRVDHTLVLAQAASRRSGVRIAPLLSARGRPEQVGLSATARKENIRGAFRASKHAARILERSPRVRVLIVLDDVRTTGATLTHACRVVSRITEGVPGAPELGKRSIWMAAAAIAGDSARRDGIGGGGSRVLAQDRRPGEEIDQELERADLTLNG